MYMYAYVVKSINIMHSDPLLHVNKNMIFLLSAGHQLKYYINNNKKKSQENSFIPFSKTDENVKKLVLVLEIDVQ